jgi:hypothetical protein
MKQLVLTLIFCTIITIVNGQFVARMEVKEDIPGLCDRNEVIAVLPGLKDQEAAVCPVSKKEILDRLNTEVQFVKDNPKFNGKGMIGLIVNCKGDVVQCKMDNKTKSEELDRQIEAVFHNLGSWKPGKLSNRDVDTSNLYSFRIKNGKFLFD